MSSVTCLECKSDIPSGLDLCPECGFQFADAPPIKCPECSKIVVFTGGVCPECGFPYDAIEELLLEEEVGAADGATFGSQAEQLSAVAKHAAAASAAQSEMERENEVAEVASAPAPAESPADASVEESSASAPASAPEGQLAALDELVATLARYLDEFKRGNDGTVQELCAGVEKFLENAEQLKLDNQGALQGMQEIAGKFSEDMKGVVEALGSAKATALAEINTTAQQGKSEVVQTSAEIQNKVGGTVDYIFYISLAVVFFTAVNIVVSMYVVKLIK